MRMWPVSGDTGEGQHMRVGRFAGISVALAAFALAGLAVVSAGDQEKAAGEKKDEKKEVKRAVIVERGGAGDTRGPAIAWTMAGGPGPRIGVSVRDSGGSGTPAGGPTGAVVDDVTEDGPAAKAGFKSGDLVTTFDGEKVRGARHFARLVEETPPGRTVKVGVIRDGKPVDLTVAPADTRDRLLVGPGAFAWRSDDGLEWQDLGELPGDLRVKIHRDVEESVRKELEKHRDAIEKESGKAAEELRHELRTLPREGFEMPAVPPMEHFEVLMGRPRLGVGIQDLTPELAQHFGAKQGVLVNAVTPDSAAARGGIKVGDVITTVDGTAVEDSALLRRQLWKRDEATEVTIGLVRDRKELSVKVKLDDPASGSRERVRKYRT